MLITLGFSYTMSHESLPEPQEVLSSSFKETEAQRVEVTLLKAPLLLSGRIRISFFETELFVHYDINGPSD